MPNSFSDVNFIPDEVVSNRQHQSQIKSLNKLSIVALVLSLVIGLGLLGYNMYTNNKVLEVEDEIQLEEARIAELNEFAESGYKLGIRLESIKDILDKRPYYGKVIEQIYEELPRGILIKNMQFSEKGGVVLSGESFPNYIPIAAFQDNLKNSDSGYFSNIRLKNASLDKSNGNANFSIEFVVNLEQTYEPIR